MVSFKRYGGDIIHSLNVALGQLRNFQLINKKDCTVERRLYMYVKTMNGLQWNPS